MQSNSKFFGLIVAAFVAAASLAHAGESKFASATNTADIVFAADPTAQQDIVAVIAKSDKSTATVKFYASTNDRAISSAPTSGAFTVAFDNTGLLFNTNDIVAYQHKDGSVFNTTVASGVTTSGVTLAAALSKAGTTNDRIHELAQRLEISIGTTALNLVGDSIYVVPANSPLLVRADGNTNVTVGVTRK